MLPSAIVVMDRLPLTPNGKIDRKALPPPAGRSIEIEGEFVPPRDPLENALAKIWAKILRVKRVGLNDNFFELGGHSLAAVLMLSEVQKLTGKTLPLATLFQTSTLEGFADLIRREGWSPSWSSLVPMQPLGSSTPLFLDRKSTRLNSSHANISYAVFCLKKKTFIRAFVATSKNAIAVTIPPTGRSWIWWVSLSRGERMVCVHVSWRSASAVSSQSQTLGH